jgi:hypothetical protein
MQARVVTVARKLGARGEEVGRRVAAGLGFQYIDDEVISWAAEQAGVSPESVSRAEHTAPALARMLANLAVAPVERAVYSSVEMLAALPDYSSQAYRHLIAQVIRDRAEEGGAVFVAHGAAIPLAGMSGVLRVMVTASPEVRARRLAEERGLTDREAAKVVEDSDRERGQFFRRIYRLDEELPTHYDLVLNTDVLSVEEAAAVALAAAKSLT